MVGPASIGEQGWDGHLRRPGDQRPVPGNRALRLSFAGDDPGPGARAGGGSASHSGVAEPALGSAASDAIATPAPALRFDPPLSSGRARPPPMVAPAVAGGPGPCSPLCGPCGPVLAIGPSDRDPAGSDPPAPAGGMARPSAKGLPAVASSGSGPRAGASHPLRSHPSGSPALFRPHPAAGDPHPGRRRSGLRPPSASGGRGDPAALWPSILLRPLCRHQQAFEESGSVAGSLAEGSSPFAFRRGSSPPGPGRAVGSPLPVAARGGRSTCGNGSGGSAACALHRRAAFRFPFIVGRIRPAGSRGHGLWRSGGLFRHPGAAGGSGGSRPVLRPAGHGIDGSGH
ncbi:hypothetical protein HRbin22_02252 [Candidatus Thermoflexus japonica]|uniref:Uncharacterized protein n=1 Tax=Candidatus Thermoflexus japonica TaxID=2035417 RepID=A0A2H5Y977_9CHLR|nr:hypothetical protein HRbin22_02252 [Candidatus Thermoflexus japonica]